MKVAVFATKGYDDVFSRLLTFPNVLVTGHQAFLTQRALGNIAETTLNNLTQLEETGQCENAVLFEEVKGTGVGAMSKADG